VDFHFWFTLTAVGIAIVVMTLEWLEPAIALGILLGTLVLAGSVSPADALAGFANPSVATVGCLLVLSSSLEHSEWIRWLVARLLGTNVGRGSLARVLISAAGLSAFMANTAIVAVYAPALRNWAHAHHRSPSKFLMPLSFACILGGACTLVGTSTNLVVDGMLAASGGVQFGMFSLLPIGLPIAVAGILFLILCAFPLLPERGVPLDRVHRDPREYTARLRITPAGPLDGHRVQSLRRLDGLFLAGVEREGSLLSPVGPDLQLRGDDILVFVGVLSKVTALTTVAGLTAVEDGAGHRDVPLESDRTHLVEAVVSPSSPLLGQTIRDTEFRGRYDAVILAVHRHGEPIAARIGDIVLRSGDTLLLITGKDFTSAWHHSRDFYLVSEAGDVATHLRARDWVEPSILGAVVLAASVGLLPLVEAAVGGVVVLLVVRRWRASETWGQFPWAVLFTIACAIGVGTALERTGVADAIARSLLAGTGGIGTAGAIAVLFVTTTLLTELVTNVAAAAMVFPLALGLADAGAVAITPLAIVVALGASLSFVTPFGYHTNAMVAGVAGYRFSDFLRLGLVTKVVCLAAGIATIMIVWG
jgi:di/tricarboxylate transporter